MAILKLIIVFYQRSVLQNFCKKLVSLDIILFDQIAKFKCCYICLFKFCKINIMGK